MKCPSCGASELARDTRDLIYKHHGQALTVMAVTADFCPVCKEALTGPAETARMMQELKEQLQQLKHGAN